MSRGSAPRGETPPGVGPCSFESCNSQPRCRDPRGSAMTQLLIRNLAQLVSPTGGVAPLRGATLGQVDVIEDAYVLAEGGTITAVGRMRDLRPPDGETLEIDGRGLCALPG